MNEPILETTFPDIDDLQRHSLDCLQTDEPELKKFLGNGLKTQNRSASSIPWNMREHWTTNPSQIGQREQALGEISVLEKNRWNFPDLGENPTYDEFVGTLPYLDFFLKN